MPTEPPTDIQINLTGLTEAAKRLAAATDLAERKRLVDDIERLAKDLRRSRRIASRKAELEEWVSQIREKASEQTMDRIATKRTEILSHLDRESGGLTGDEQTRIWHGFLRRLRPDADPAVYAMELRKTSPANLEALCALLARAQEPDEIDVAARQVVRMDVALDELGRRQELINRVEELQAYVRSLGGEAPVLDLSGAGDRTMELAVEVLDTQAGELLAAQHRAAEEAARRRLEEEKKTSQVLAAQRGRAHRLRVAAVFRGGSLFGAGGAALVAGIGAATYRATQGRLPPDYLQSIGAVSAIALTGAVLCHTVSNVLRHGRAGWVWQAAFGLVSGLGALALHLFSTWSVRAESTFVDLAWLDWEGLKVLCGSLQPKADLLAFSGAFGVVGSVLLSRLLRPRPALRPAGPPAPSPVVRETAARKKEPALQKLDVADLRQTTLAMWGSLELVKPDEFTPERAPERLGQLDAATFRLKTWLLPQLKQAALESEVGRFFERVETIDAQFRGAGEAAQRIQAIDEELRRFGKVLGPIADQASLNEAIGGDATKDLVRDIGLRQLPGQAHLDAMGKRLRQIRLRPLSRDAFDRIAAVNEFAVAATGDEVNFKGGKDGMLATLLVLRQPGNAIARIGAAVRAQAGRNALPGLETICEMEALVRIARALSSAVASHGAKSGL